MTHDTWGGVNILLKCQVPSSYGLGVAVFWRYFHKEWLSEWINEWITKRSVGVGQTWLHWVCKISERAQAEPDFVMLRKYFDIYFKEATGMWELWTKHKKKIIKPTEVVKNLKAYKIVVNNSINKKILKFNRNYWKANQIKTRTDHYLENDNNWEKVFFGQM